MLSAKPSGERDARFRNVQGRGEANCEGENGEKYCVLDFKVHIVADVRQAPRTQTRC